MVDVKLQKRGSKLKGSDARPTRTVKPARTQADECQIGAPPAGEPVLGSFQNCEAACGHRGVARISWCRLRARLLVPG